MKFCTSLAFILLFAPIAVAADSPEPKKGVTVHEWGVFRVNEDAQFANADLRAEWDDLPEFVYGHIKGRLVPQDWGALEIRRRPIIFFHAEEPTVVRVKIEFPGGLAGVWFPGTESPVVFRNRKQPAPGDSLLWSLGIKQLPTGWKPKQPQPPPVPDRHWIGRVREVNSDEVFGLCGNGPDADREKFIYYDGIFPHGKWMKIAVEKDRVTLTSQVKHPVFDITVVDRRNDRVRIGRVAKLDGGVTIKEVPFTRIDSAKISTEGAETLVKQLIAFGLYEDEAKSLADLWKKEMFETPGLNLFYRLPQEEYDRRLPLTITPNAESTVRAGLVFHAHLEPDFADQIVELVKRLDSSKYAERDAATKKLLQIGPAALVQLERTRARKDLSIEVESRLDALLKKWKSRQAFEENKD
jgi:hypothetical protein